MFKKLLLLTIFAMPIHNVIASGTVPVTIRDAAKAGDLDAFIRLLPTLYSSEGQWVLNDAAKNGHLNIVSYILDIEKENTPSRLDNGSEERNIIIFRMAGVSGSIEMVNHLLSRLNEFNMPKIRNKYYQDTHEVDFKKITTAVYTRAAMLGHLGLMEHMERQAHNVLDVPAPDQGDFNDAFAWAAGNEHVGVLIHLSNKCGSLLSQRAIDVALTDALSYGRSHYSVETVNFLMNPENGRLAPSNEAIRKAIFEVERSPEIVKHINLDDRAIVLALLKREQPPIRRSLLINAGILNQGRSVLRNDSAANEREEARAIRYQEKIAAEQKAAAAAEMIRRQEEEQRVMAEEEARTVAANQIEAAKRAYLQESALRTQARIDLFRGDIIGEIIPDKSRQIVDKSKDTTDDSGTKAAAIYRFKTVASDESRSYIIKELKNDYEQHTKEFSEFGREKTLVHSGKVREWKALMQDYRLQSLQKGVKLPELTDYIATREIIENGKVVPLTLMQRGYGKTLTEINNSLHTLTDEEAIRMGTNIGQQMGAMTRAFFLTNRTILAHGDFQRPNLMYSKNKEQFYWIDLGGTREIAYIPGGGAQNYEASYFDIYPFHIILRTI